MKHTSKRFAGVALAAGMLFSSAVAVLPQNMNSLVVYAGENDFNWNTYAKKDASWWKSSEATALADEMIKYQLSDGGWRKDMKTESSGSWNKSTIDNNATWGQIRFLASVYNATGTEKYKTSCLKALDLLFNGQYSNGGWPQVFNDAGTYHAHITYNDTAMVSVLRVLLEVSQKSGSFAWIDNNYQKKAQNAVDKGVECILNTQITVNGTLTAWCQQHDEKTLAPAGARAYELPSLCTIFQSCDLVWAGYSDKAVGGYITAKTNTGKYLFSDCNVSGASGMKVGEGNFGRPWSGDADVAFVNTKLSSESMICAAGWGKMSNNDPANANFKEYNTTVNGKAVNTSGRIKNTVKTSANGLDVDTYLNGWKPYYYSNTPSGTDTPVIISGTYIKDLTLNSNALPELWKLDSNIQIGDLIYTDRDGVTYTEIPSGLVGAEAIVTPCDAKKVESDLGVFTANGDITVYIVLDSRVTAVPSWLSGWNNTGLTVKNSQDVVYDLYSKDFNNGEKITLGSNGQTSGCTGYAALVAKAGTVPAQITGDVNADGKFDITDVVLLQKWLLAVPDTHLADWKAADLCEDGRLDVFDLCMMKKELVNKQTVIDTPVEPTILIVTNTYESADFKFSGKVYIVGDSTVCNYDEAAQKNQNRCGWGMKLGEQYNGVTVTNLARAGRSSRSFLTENEYKTMCNSIGKGDYLFVQFGHNDEKTDDAARGTYPGLDFSTLDKDGKNSAGQYSYEWVILNKYVKVAQANGATVVLVTPVTRRGSNGAANYKSHVAYAEGLVKLGKEYNIPVINMTTKTAELYTQLYSSGGADATAELHCYSDDTRTSIDNTHLSIKGCTIIADMIAEETANLNLKISEKLK